MAQQIQTFGGACPGNNLNEDPTAIYSFDPPVLEAGHKQVLNCEVFLVKGRGKGISMVTGCSTAVCNSDGEKNRPAFQTFTLEFPGNLIPTEYNTTEEQEKVTMMIDAFATSVQHYFLQPFFVEEATPENEIRFASH